jgi:hypothetical protein
VQDVALVVVLLPPEGTPAEIAPVGNIPVEKEELMVKE